MSFWAAAGGVMVLTGIAAFYAIGELSVFSIANVIVGGLLLALAAAVSGRRFRGFTGTRSRRLALRWAAVLGAGLVVVVGANLAAMRSGATLDLTAARQYTLSDQTLQLCERLPAEAEDDPVDLLLFEDALLAKDVRLLVAAYDRACPITSRELSAAEAPPAARQILESYDTTVVLCRGDSCDYVGFPSEENITNALLRLSRAYRPQVYFSVGHGEVDLGSERDHGFTALVGYLRDEGIDLRAFVGVANEAIPEDANVLVIAAPERDTLEAELAAIDRYLEGGGRLLVLAEPGTQLGLYGLLNRWGFGLPEAVVADRQSSPLLESPRPISIVANAFETQHPIARKMSARTMLLLPGVRPVLPERKPQPGDELRAIVYSSRRSWAESSVQDALNGREIGPDPGELGGQELPIAAAGRYPRGDREARIVVIGDSDFASNRWVNSLYNRDLIVNALLWLAQAEEQLAIRPKLWTPDTHPLPLETTLAYFYSLAFALPELLLLLGLRAWYRQRT